jgi:hypothetical protein
MKKILFSILLLTVGVVIGVVVTSFLSMVASKSFINIVRINYQIEEQIKAIKAKKNADIKQAIVHYRNLVEASSSPGLYCFNDKRDLWSIDFPFAAVILGKISKSIPNQAKGAERVAAINRAMLADALEKSGDTKAANYEYAKAANIIGLGNDIQKLKKIVQTIMSHDEAFLEMENQYTYTETK